MLQCASCPGCHHQTDFSTASRNDAQHRKAQAARPLRLFLFARGVTPVTSHRSAFTGALSPVSSSCTVFAVRHPASSSRFAVKPMHSDPPSSFVVMFRRQTSSFMHFFPPSPSIIIKYPQFWRLFCAFFTVFMLFSCPFFAFSVPF